MTMGYVDLSGSDAVQIIYESRRLDRSLGLIHQLMTGVFESAPRSPYRDSMYISVSRG